MEWKLYPLKEINTKWEEWDRLNCLYYNRHPFFDSRFIKPCVKFFGDDYHKLAELKDNHGIVRGMLLLTKKRWGLWSLFVPSQLQIAPVFLPPKQTSEHLKKLMQILPGYCYMIDILYQDPLNTQIDNELKLYYKKINHCATTNINLNPDFETFWMNRPKNFKHNIRKSFNRLKKKKIKFSFLVRTSSKEIINALNSYGLLESNSWKGKEGTAIHPNNIQGQFYKEVLLGFSNSGNAAVYEFYIENELAGSMLSISNNRMLILLKTTFNEKYKAYSPGRLVQYNVLKNVFSYKRFEVVETYTNANKDQIDWSTSSRIIFHAEIYRNKLVEKIKNLKERNLQ